VPEVFLGEEEEWRSGEEGGEVEVAKGWWWWRKRCCCFAGECGRRMDAIINLWDCD
jgi:hypothetical protein